MSIVVGTLTIDLVANTASFASEMGKASNLAARSANDIKRSLEKIAAAGVAMGAAIATGTVALIKSAIDSADELGKMAQSAGTSVETLSTLGYAARLSGLQMDQLGTGLVRLSKAAFQAQNGNVQLERIFGRLGVSVTDSNGHLKDSGVLLGQLATKFSGVADGAGKTAIATALFGKSGAALIPFLNEYGEKQAEINDEAHHFGLVLNMTTTEAAASAQEKLKKLSSIVEGIGYALLGATLPALDQLGQKLIQIAYDANIPDLAKAFGEKVTTAVTSLGNALEFAEKHAHGLKIALEAVAGLKIAAIAIPVIGDLQKGGIANVGKGLDALTRSFFGLERALPVLEKFSSWVLGLARTFGSLAASEGIAETATLMLGEAFAGPVGWIALAITAVGSLAAAIYKFRDSTFTVKGQTYELRDTWAAAWIEMKDALAPVGNFFGKLVGDIKDLWMGMVNWIKQNSIAKSIMDDVGKAAVWVVGLRLDKTDIAALNKARDQRLSANYTGGYETHPEQPYPAAGPKKPPLDTAGLGKPQKDIFGDEVRKLDLAIAQQKAYLAVLDGTPEKLEEVAAAEKARGVILELNNRLTDEGRAKLTAHQEAIILQKTATEASLKALNDYGKELVSQQHGADLSIQQARALAAANLEGDAAIRATAVDNAILGLTFNRTAEQIRTMTPELAKLRGLLTAKASADLVAGTNRDIQGLRDELAERQLVNAAALESVDVQRQAALASKLYPLDREIDQSGNTQERQALLAKRDALVAVTKAEWDANDAQAALSLLSPAEQYEREMESLNRAEEALRALQGGTLSYGQQLGVAARQQDAFNKATDDTVNLLVREGSMGDGVKAFFLKMQEEAKSAATQIYDVLTETFNKLSSNLTDLITAPNSQKRKEAINQFANMFTNIGKNLMDSTIKGQLQRGLGALGNVFGVKLGGGKPDGSTEQNALWVRFGGLPLSGQGLDQKLAGGPATIARSLLGGGGEGEGSDVASGGGRNEGSAGGGLFSSIGHLFGRKSVPSTPSITLPAFPRATGTNELQDLLGGTPSPQPPSSLSSLQSIPMLLRAASSATSSGSSGNDMQDLAASTSSLPSLPQPSPSSPEPPAVQLSPSSPQPASPFSLLSIPSMLRQGAAGALLGASLLGAPMQAAASPASTSPTASGSVVSGLPTGSGAVLPATPPIWSQATAAIPATSAMPAATVVPIGNPPDVQPKDFTQITRPQPTLADKILGAGVTLAGNIGGSLLGGAITGGGSGSSASSSSGDSGAWVQAAQPDDNTPNGIVTIPMAVGGRVSGRVSGPGSGTSDSIPAMLSHGEYVINASATAKHLPLLHKINKGFASGGVVPGFAGGGLVGVRGYDEGGLVSPSMAYVTGDRGTDMMANASAQIGSASASSTSSGAGDQHTWHIDARGNPDPAQTIAQTARMMRTAAPQIAASAVHAMKDQQLRRPGSAK